MARGVFFYTNEFQGYDMGPEHPLKPIRLARTHSLLQSYGALDQLEVRVPSPCSLADLRTTHSDEFIQAVDRFSSGEPAAFAHRWGFGYGDNPIFPGMYEASLLYTGGSVDAAQAVMDGAKVAINLSGGLHHAHYDRAAGFCTFNDCAVAIHRLRRKYQRIAYVDIDVHHGDGVQEAFYDDPCVLTVSIHQSGRTLFPGTGFVHELGVREGAGYSVNVPVWPLTTDEIWLRAFREAAMPLLRAFDPEAIVLQMGADPHYLDPLALVCLTAQGWLEAVRDVISLDRPIVALGGGGYNQTTVPRMWTLAVAALCDLQTPDATPESYAWHAMIPNLTDAEQPAVAPDDQDRARAFAVETIAAVRSQLFERHGLPAHN